MKIGIVGAGFVGSAVDYGFTHCEKFIVDPKLGTTLEDLYDFDPDYTFVCVPTPMGENGVIDASIVHDVVDKLILNTSTIVILKSTVTPDHLQKYTTLSRFVYNPEFLTEKSANEDFANPFMHVFGGLPGVTQSIEALYKEYSICKPCPTYHMSVKEASFVKYGINAFLMSKVLWFNQYHDLVESQGCSYTKIINAIGTDGRINPSHTMVPGHDGRRGAALSCFSKDIPALIHFSEGELSILKEAWNVNCDYRNAYAEPLHREKEQKIVFRKM